MLQPIKVVGGQGLAWGALEFPLGAGGQGGPSLVEGHWVDVLPTPSTYTKAPLAPWLIHLPLLSSSAWLPCLELCPRARGNFTLQTLSRC
jgi:hypothetical protein